MEKKMQTTIVYGGYIKGIMEHKVGSIVVILGSRRGEAKIKSLKHWDL